MSDTFKKVGVGVVIVVLALLFFWYWNNKIQNDKKIQMSVNKTSLDLDQLILNSHDCGTVIAEATAFLKTNPNAEHIWVDLGSCQYDMGKFADAKTSFEKAFSLNASDEGVQTYLKKLNATSTNALAVTVVGPATNLLQSEFESTIGFKFPKSYFQFAGADKRVAPDNSLHLSAVYLSQQSLKNTTSYAKSQLTKAGMTVSEQTIASSTLLLVDSHTSQLTLNVLEDSNKLVQVIVKYIKF